MAILIKWLVGKMTIWQNDLLTKRLIVKMKSQQYNQLSKWPVDKTVNSQNVSW